MFGFGQPVHPSRAYRALYSRACQHHRAIHGDLAAVFHSYEAVFLYSCAFDANLFDRTCVRSQTCCRLRRITDRVGAPDARVAEYCSHAAALLMSVKMRDDLRDHNKLARLRAQLLSAAFRRPFLQTKRYFNSAVPSLLRSLNEQIDLHHRMESHNQSSLSLDQFAEPTARGFALLFGGLALIVDNTLARYDCFWQLGYHLGAALLAADCAGIGAPTNCAGTLTLSLMLWANDRRIPPRCNTSKTCSQFVKDILAQRPSAQKSLHHCVPDCWQSARAPVRCAGRASIGHSQLGCANSVPLRGGLSIFTPFHHFLEIGVPSPWRLSSPIRVAGCVAFRVAMPCARRPRTKCVVRRVVVTTVRTVATTVAMIAIVVVTTCVTTVINAETTVVISRNPFMT